MTVRDRELLKRYISFHDGTQSQLAKAMGISLSRLNAKINETQDAEFNPTEVAFIRNRYGFSDEETDKIFYTKSSV